MRKSYLDNIRISVVLLVVIYHIFYIYNSVCLGGVGAFREVQYQDAIQYILYPWFMVLLFVVSGIASRCYLDNHSIRDFVKARTRKLLVPSTLGLLVFGWIQGYFSMAAGGAFEHMGEIPVPVLYLIMCLSGTGVLWFAQMVWFFSMLLALIRRFEKGKLHDICSKCSLLVLGLLVIPMWISMQILNTPIVLVYRFGEYGFAFFLGYFLFSNDDVVDKLSSVWGYLAAIAAFSGLAFTIMNFGKDYTDSAVLNSPLSAFYLWTMILAILGYAKKHWNKETKLTKAFNKKTHFCTVLLK